MRRWWIVIGERADLCLLVALYAGMLTVALCCATSADGDRDGALFAFDVAPVVELKLRGDAATCVLENVVVGDGAIRAGARCAPTLPVPRQRAGSR